MNNLWNQKYSRKSRTDGQLGKWVDIEWVYGKSGKKQKVYPWISAITCSFAWARRRDSLSLYLLISLSVSFVVSFAFHVPSLFANTDTSIRFPTRLITITPRDSVFIFAISIISLTCIPSNKSQNTKIESSQPQFAIRFSAHPGVLAYVSIEIVRAQ